MAERPPLPPIATTTTVQPWTRWWWLGSAVDEAEIDRHLELLRAAGFGGVEVSPIYGVPGSEARAVPFLSPRWIELLRYTVRAARGLGLDVDLIAGTGWPYGGPGVSAADAATRAVVERYELPAGATLREPIRSQAAPDARLAALTGYGPGGAPLDLLPHVDAGGTLQWQPTAGLWTLYALFETGTGQQVKRAAPGGEGLVVDHFSGDAVRRYLATLDGIFADAPPDERVRAVFNDSYEVYGANWTPALWREFAARRGYDLRLQLRALAGDDTADVVTRVRSDYRETVGELLLERFVEPWAAWAHAHGVHARNQAHGSPGNLLDLYAAADIPETETFGPDWMRLAGLAPMPGTPPEQGGRADLLVGKFASSAAHVAGRQLCASEMFTWLDEHGKVPLAHMKAEADLAFLMGVNHLIFHGTPFSPAELPWPGWLFYASTHVAPSNPFWRDLPALNSYIAGCQSSLQAGRTAPDVLLYLPIAELWASAAGAEDWLQYATVHSHHWLDQGMPGFAAAARRLWARGYDFDMVSDRQLATLDVAAGQIQAPGAGYQALVIAGCSLLHPETLERVVALAEAGATVLVVGELPGDVPGLADLDQRRARLRAATPALRPLAGAEPIRLAVVGSGRLLVGPEVEALLDAAGVRREPMADAGLAFVRRRLGTDTLYFVVNRGPEPVDQWVALRHSAAYAALVDPLTGQVGAAALRAGAAGGSEVYLQLEPGASLVIRLSAAFRLLPWPYRRLAGAPIVVQGSWRVEFIAGGPTLPEPATTTELVSWTDWPVDRAALRAFSGTARYTLRFEHSASPGADDWALDLGMVCHSAHVWLNGQDLGSLIGAPFRVLARTALRSGENELVVEVTNLMANRIAALEREGTEWRPFFMVDIAYQGFAAAAWVPLPSGLLGPVRLLPLSRLEPSNL